MRRFMTTLGVLALACAWAWASPQKGSDTAAKQEQTVAQKKVAEITAEFDTARSDFFKKYRAAKTADERQKLVETSYPDPEKYAARLKTVAEAHRKDPGARDALQWIVRQSRKNLKYWAATRLLDDHASDADLGGICSSFAYDVSPAAEAVLERVRGIDDMKCKAYGTFFLASIYKRRANMARRYASADAATKEQLAKNYGEKTAAVILSASPDDLTSKAVGLFEKVATDKNASIKVYGGSIVDMAKQNIFEIRNLSIGRPVPDIEGTDIDGVAFKLSDYRGKVVMLDFWGNW